MYMIKKVKMKLFATIWELSEFTGIGLGKFAPYVFERMIGIKGERID